MEINIRETCIIKLSNDDLADIISGERRVFHDHNGLTYIIQHDFYIDNEEMKQ